MKVWLIGASRIGTEILRQLQKNEEIEVVVSDTSPRPLAVREGVIEKLDYIETVTPVNVNSLARRLYPDLILVDTGAESRNQVAAQIAAACAEWDFFQGANHDVSTELVERVWAEKRRFFNLPRDKKLAILRSRENPRGFYD